eukprot:TRINITY_DN27277_c0_g1_i1.p1 TRINITY_DN27277_c0_g1~~TRINITY_DN27277_c0_g1_i1.p1  ORF type:complete len:353 (+),score=49.23 TRINITY_DN27277_c0_g1_i1:116-1174(+)
MQGVLEAGERVRFNVPLGRPFSLVIRTDAANGGLPQTIRFDENGVQLDHVAHLRVNVNVRPDELLEDQLFDDASQDDMPPGPGVPQSVLDSLPQVSPSELGRSSDCAICFQSLSSLVKSPSKATANHAVRLPCEHSFHRHCISTWLQSHTACPLCRHDVLQPAANSSMASQAAAQSADPREDVRQGAGRTSQASPRRAVPREDYRQGASRASRAAPRRAEPREDHRQGARRASQAAARMAIPSREDRRLASSFEAPGAVVPLWNVNSFSNEAAARQPSSFAQREMLRSSSASSAASPAAASRLGSTMPRRTRPVRSSAALLGERDELSSASATTALQRVGPRVKLARTAGLQ